MDLRRARIWEWLAGGLGATVAVSTFLPWYSCSSDGSPPCRGGGTLSAWSAFSVTDVLLLVAGLWGVAVLVLTVTQRTPALPLATTSLGVVVAIVAAILAVIALAVGPSGPVAGADGGARLVGAWLGALSAVASAVALLAAIRDERVPDAAPGMEGAAPEPRTLTLSGRAAASASGEPIEGGGAA